MPQFKCLIIGGGMTVDSAVHGIRELDSTGSIGLISADSDPPYNRPPLSKGLWKGDAIDGIWRDTADQGVQMFMGRTVRSLDPAGKQVSDDQGARYDYEKLLIATGGSPRRFPFGGDDIVYFRTLADYRRLRAMADAHQRIGVIGGGYIGSEIAAGLAVNGKQVVMFMLEGTVNGDRYPANMGQFLNDYYTQKGVEVVPYTAIGGLQKRGSQYAIQGRTGQDAAAREWLVDGVVAGLGIIPNVDLAKAAGLAVDNGIVVDEFLRTANADIYAAGDVAAAYQRLLDKRVRIEHEDNANLAGIAAGVLSGLAYAAYSLMGRSASQQGLNPWTTLLYTFGFAALILLVANLLPGGVLPGSATRPADLLWLGNALPGWGILFLLAAGPTVAGFGLYNVSLSHLPSSVANLVVTLEPAFTAVTAYLLLGERLNALQLGGGAMILGAVVLLRISEGRREAQARLIARTDHATG